MTYEWRCDEYKVLLTKKTHIDKLNASDLYMLGLMYYTGYGNVRKNSKTAIKYFTLSANQGHLCSNEYLGHCYDEYGLNTRQGCITKKQ